LPLSDPPARRSHSEGGSLGVGGPAPPCLPQAGVRQGPAPCFSSFVVIPNPVRLRTGVRDLLLPFVAQLARLWSPPAFCRTRPRRVPSAVEGPNHGAPIKSWDVHFEGLADPQMVSYISLKVRADMTIVTHRFEIRARVSQTIFMDAFRTNATREKRQQVFIENRSFIAWLRLKDTFANITGWCLERIGAPARLKEFEFVDPETDETVYLFTDKRFAVLCVGSRRFYFDRLTGKFDGTSAPACSVPGWVEFRD
jgi:hypothetical protein